MMLESPDLRWAFIRKIYSILTVQMLLTVAVAAVVVTVRPISHFFVSSGAGLGLYIFLIILPFIVLCPLYYYHQTHPWNYLFLGIFTVSLSFAVGLTCAFTSGKVILESVILTAVVVVSLTLYTFWAARRGYDFSFLGPFLFAAVMILIIFALIQILFPLGRISVMIYGGLAAIIFCGYIIYDTDNLIKRYSYDEYIFAAVALYIDIINLFLSLLTLFRAAET
ncbi:protein LIFEGUARD 2 [Cocos nucifera]|uniref:Protein LIFEGUARD 2 n=1 Tax=Cocos nucifera TaxID=13894 RepID=A0A8K0N678_COCNU|nr:protein LIFEGUARD 2 [Cocos nucifera]